MTDDQPVTKRDLDRSLHDLRQELERFIVEREVVATRWMIGIQITYFFGTLAAVWFMLAHYKP
jgi:hypothetical protein